MTSRMTSTPTTEQIEVLMDFLEELRNLARRMLRNVEGRAHSHQLWENICTTLNSMGGCMIENHKTVGKSLDIQRVNSPKTAVAARRFASATGGGRSTARQLSHWESQVISTKGDGFGEPQTSAWLAAFPEVHTSPENVGGSLHAY